MAQTPASSPRTTAPPRLESGDRLTRAEFERRYAAATDVHRAELVEGVVYVASPVRFDLHSEPEHRLAYWLRSYVSAAPQLRSGSNPTPRLDADNEVQPDLMLMVPESHGGQCILAASGYLEGAPELVIEVAASSVSYDLHDKRHAYRRNGVREYVVWRTEDRAVDWFVQREGAFERLAADSDQVYRSQVFPGLWLDTAALLAGDDRALIERLQQGLQTAEHAAFAAALRTPGADWV